MIVAYRIPQISEQMRAATLRAAAQRGEDPVVRSLVERLTRRGYQVTLTRRAA